MKVVRTIDVGVLRKSGRMMDKPEEFKVNSRNLDLNLDFGFSITANEGKI